jgi:hypothetical protein
MAKLNDLIVTIGANTRRFDKGLGDSMRKMKQFGKNTKALGRNLTRSLTMPLAALGGLAVKTAADFEFSMAKVAAVSGFAANEMKALEAQAKQLGGSTSKSASEVAGLQLELAKLGKSSKEIENMTEDILSLGIAFDKDLGETAAVVGQTLNQFGMDASETGRVADNMAVLFGSSSLDLEKYSTAMSTVGLTANTLGISLEDTGSALGILVDAGVDASTAGTSLTKAFTKLVQSGVPANEVLNHLTSGNLSVADSFEFFGDRAGKIIPALQGAGEEIAALTEKQLAGAGAAKTARKVLEDTAKGGFDALKSAVEAAGISIGTALMPTVKRLTGFFTTLASKLASVDSGMQTQLVTILAVIAGIGPLLMILPSIVSGFTLLISPIGLVVAAIVGLAIAIIKYADIVAPYITDIINYFITLYNESDAVRILVGFVKTAFVQSFKNIFTVIGIVVGRVKDLGKAFMQIFTEGDFSGALDTMKKSLMKGFEGMQEMVVDTADAIKKGIDEQLQKNPIELVSNEAVEKAIATVGGLTDMFASMTGGGGGGGGGGEVSTGATGGGGANIALIDNALPEPTLIRKSSTAVSDLAGNQAELNKEIGISIGLGPQMSNAFVGMGMAIGGLVTGTMTMTEVFANALTGLADLLIDLGSQFIAAGAMATQFYANLIANPPVAIAAGVGLVAAGAVIKGLQSRMESSPPALAQGGLAFGPTMAVVGDNRNAGVDPEVIAPLSKLQSMMGGSSVQVTGKISGRDILLTSERNAIDRNRVRGF